MLLGYQRAADAFTSTAAERAVEPLAWWQKRICDPDGMSQAFGAFHEGLLIGGVTVEYSVKTKTKHKAHVIGMYVLGEHRHLGAGHALLHAVINHAKLRTGVKMLVLTLTEGNLQAKRLYESAGFEQFGLEPIAIFTGTKYKSKVHMLLMLPVRTQNAA